MVAELCGFRIWGSHRTGQDFIVDDEDSIVVDEYSVALGREEVEAGVEVACVVWLQLLSLISILRQIFEFQLE